MKLRVLHGTLKRRSGKSAGEDVAVHAKRFVIGSAADCQMRCPNPSISPHHCEILEQQGSYAVRDLNSVSGTFLNEQPLRDQQLLKNGDHLRVGRLEFEIVIEPPIAEPPVQITRQAARPSDLVGERISEMLVAADQEERAQRFEDPAKRRFTRSAPVSAAPTDVEPEKKKPVLPPKKPPMKLPPAPKVVADNTVDAAEEVLKKYFDRPKK